MRRVGALLAAIGLLLCLFWLVRTLVVQAPPELRATGIVVAVHAKAPLAVASFDLRTETGTIMTFDIGELDYSRGSFNPAHLVVHEATALPIVVTYHTADGTRVATLLIDECPVAPTPSGSSSAPPCASAPLAP